MNQITSMLARSSDGAMLVDRDGKVIYWNRAAERLLGFKANEILGRSCHDVLRGKTVSGQPFCAPNCWIRNLVSRGTGVRNYNLRTHTKAKQPVWLNVSTLPVPTRTKGEFLSLFLFRDTTVAAKTRQLIGASCALMQAEEDPLACERPTPEGSEAQARTPRAPSQSFALTKREKEILSLVAEGKATKTIAHHLCVSASTVRNHVQHIFGKLGVHSRLQAVALALHAPCGAGESPPSDERLRIVSTN